MKRFALLNILLFASPLTAFPNRPAVAVISTRRDIFYFKIDKTFVGASIEVYNAEGKIILTDRITHHKAIIDFYMEQPGIYKILVKKDERTVSFAYTKVDPVPYSPEPFENSISITQ